MAHISSASTHSASADLTEQYRAKEAQKEEIQKTNEKEIDHLKEAYSLQKADMVDRFESATQAEQTKHYENLRNTKRSIHRAEEDLDHKKEQIISNKTQEINREQIDAEVSGKQAIDDTKRKYMNALEYEKNKALEAETLVRSSHKQNSEAIIKDSESKMANLYSAKKNELETASARNSEAIQQIQDFTEKQKQDTSGNYFGQLKKLQKQTQNDLDARRLQNAQSLDAYSARQNDPFYQMVKTDAEFSDLGHAFVIRVRVPEYEREKYKVQISGNELQMSGARTNNEKTEIAPGNWISTSSYQTFTERFPLPSPVDPNTLVSREDGEFLEYSVLKYGPKHKLGAHELQVAKDKRILAGDKPKEVDFPNELIKPSIIPKGSRGTGGTLS